MEHNRQQTIKALECCQGEEGCKDCPYRCGNSTCVSTVIGDALSLIKELTEENERLREERAQRPPKLIITKVPKKENKNV